ncbi:serine/threonine protein kinase [Saccharothrix coeruleofusca]|uniref:serine/threonine-protein kinase n=1 Tax=Saccharothrix coeruleofusca TaxID=33919 RepID=UPI001AE168DE|nr:serine/threonine-protein kinase [Saccharothrix coeruleofusca]MBP2336153.1 serine/threonine protein kinase [Saccharothrix coeruleofusca]
MSPSVSATDSLVAARYRLVDVLARGGAADVHRAWDTLLRRHVAVKVFRRGADPTASLRFDNEVRTLAGLCHHGLVSVYDAGTSDRTPFVVLQLVEGRTLRERIAEGPMALEEVRRLGAQVADALAHVHANDVVHRDVKPSNVLLDEEGRAYLADFGSARAAGAGGPTGLDRVVGTPSYLAPEQVRGEEAGPPADVYAFGLVLLECLTGRREYDGDEVEAAVARLRRPPAIPDDLPEDLARLLASMTSLSARRRPGAAECARVLRTGGSCLDQVFPVLLRDEEDAEVPQPRLSKRALLASATALLGAIGASWVVAPSEPAAPPPDSGITAPGAPQQQAADTAVDADQPVRLRQQGTNGR